MPEDQGYIMPEPSWDLRIFIPDLQVEKSLRVRGDMHIGGVMLRLVEELDILIDWSDHAFWWPKRNCWLTKTRQTLNHYCVAADSYLNFTPMHKPLRVQLPDLRYIDARVDFSVPCFKAVELLCKELGIRHSEELSFQRPLSAEHLRKNYQNVGVTPGQRAYSGGGTTNGIAGGGGGGSSSTMRAGGTDTLGGQASPYGLTGTNQSGTIDTRSHSPDITSTLSRHASYRGFTTTYSTTMLAEDLKNLEISNSPHSVSEDSKGSLLYPKNLAEKARLNAGWLDSHLSLYQQNVRDFDTLQLRFKYREFYDLNPKLDMARINQIYEQAKWSLLTEETECSEDEMMMFGALKYQIEQQASNPIPDDIGNANDDIDAALTELELQLQGGGGAGGHSTTVYERTSFNNRALSPTSAQRYQATATGNSKSFMQASQHQQQVVDPTTVVSALELCDWIRFMKVKKFTFKTFKRLFFVFRDTTLSAYRNKEDRLRDEAAFAIDLRGCDVTPDVYINHNKYGVKLSTPSLDGLIEYLLRFDNETQYARWMAAFKLASRGKPLTDPSYEEEMRTTLESFNLQQYIHPTSHSLTLTSNNNLRLDDYAATTNKSTRSRSRVGRSSASRILEANSNAKHLSATELKLNYIKAWRTLPDYGIHMFVVQFGGSNREEILGIGADRLVRIDASNGDHLRVWPFHRMKTWRVNWDSRQVLVQSEDGDVSFSCLSADCKIPHEFIGGYVFLSMRSKDNNQTLNENLFYKLTRGWDD